MATVYTDGSRFPTISRYLANRQTDGDGNLESMSSVYDRWFNNQSVKQNLDADWNYELLNANDISLPQFIWRLQEWTSKGDEILNVKVKQQGTPDENNNTQVNFFHVKLKDRIRYDVDSSGGFQGTPYYNDVRKVSQGTRSYTHFPAGNPNDQSEWWYAIDWLNEDGDILSPVNNSSQIVYNPDSDNDSYVYVNVHYVTFANPDTRLFTVLNRNADGEYDSVEGLVFGDLIQVYCTVEYYGPTSYVSGKQTRDIYAVSKLIKIAGAIPKDEETGTSGNITYATENFTLNGITFRKNTQTFNYSTAYFMGGLNPNNYDFTYRGSPEGGIGPILDCVIDITQEKLDTLFRAQW